MKLLYTILKVTKCCNQICKCCIDIFLCRIVISQYCFCRCNSLFYCCPALCCVLRCIKALDHCNNLLKSCAGIHLIQVFLTCFQSCFCFIQCLFRCLLLFFCRIRISQNRIVCCFCFIPKLSLKIDQFSQKDFDLIIDCQNLIVLC